MDFEATLSNAADTKADTPVVQEQDGKTVVVIQQIPAAEPEETTDSDSLLSSALDSQPVDESGLPAVVKSVFGEYHPRTQTVTETRTDGTVLTSVECDPGLAGLDWYWLSGVFMFALVLWSYQDRGSALAEFKNFGLVAGEVGEEIPFEILVVDQLGVQAQLDTAVAHFADILPCLVESDDVNNGSLKQQVPGNLVIEVCREFQPVVP